MCNPIKQSCWILYKVKDKETFVFLMIFRKNWSNSIMSLTARHIEKDVCE